MRGVWSRCPEMSERQGRWQAQRRVPHTSSFATALAPQTASTRVDSSISHGCEITATSIRARLTCRYPDVPEPAPRRAGSAEPDARRPDLRATAAPIEDSRSCSLPSLVMPGFV